MFKPAESRRPAAACTAVRKPASLEHRLPKLPVVFADTVTGPWDDAGEGARDGAGRGCARDVHAETNMTTSKVRLNMVFISSSKSFCARLSVWSKVLSQQREAVATEFHCSGLHVDTSRTPVQATLALSTSRVPH